MHSLLKIRIASNSFEIGIVAFLLIAVSFRATIGLSGTFVAITHISALLLAYILSQHIVSLINKTIGRLYFASIVMLLLIEAGIQFLTGLHVNWFVISLLLEDNSSQNIGISFTIWIAAIFIIFVLTFMLRTKISHRRNIYIPIHFIFLGGAISIASGQAVYSIAHYSGVAKIMHVKRNLPFFFAPHPYHIRSILEVFNEQHDEDTPFSRAQVKRGEEQGRSHQNDVLKATTNKPNILFIITDSVRAAEIKNYPALTPTINAAATRGYFSLGQYSVSNCTHFSLYSMFTGRIPTTFGEARQNASARGLVPELAGAGYSVSTAETISLNWYDIQKTILPDSVNRWIAPSELDDNTIRDQATTKRTIEELNSWSENDTPRLHITYFEGSHFPYNQAITNAGDTIQERYRESIRLFDQQLSDIFTALEDQNLMDNTLVIVTSDHGDELLSEGRMGHSSALNDNQVVVPLLILGGNENTANIRSHADIRQFVLNQLSPEAYPFEPPEAIYLANCDYDHPKDFRVLTDTGEYNFDYDDGYLVPIDDKQEQSLNAAKLLIKTIQNGGIPAQP
ncbi:sulfatase-like hydrolase/transferase [Kordiimonas aquimaris]|uniref:sulfatase-like hydrolase/transferase n=1 Tax=Kordiimonas aquimaris TaxID=707591 RepID=UPI0021D031F8|nr:sulfatase-like hydrolase/transferase [Kordiimonas aquimaris]